VRKDVLSMLLKVDYVVAERMSSERLFQSTEPATRNATLAKYKISSKQQSIFRLVFRTAIAPPKWLSWVGR